MWGAFEHRMLTAIAHVGDSMAEDQAPTLWGMFVRPEWRRQSIGSSLLDMVIRTCRASEQTSTAIRLYVASDNVAAISMYRRSGFMAVPQDGSEDEHTTVMVFTPRRESTAKRHSR
ncbi:MAG: GNAT family N-acetyltransferase [Pseudomonadota bacterium]